MILTRSGCSSISPWTGSLTTWWKQQDKITQMVSICYEKLLQKNQLQLFFITCCILPRLMFFFPLCFCCSPSVESFPYFVIVKVRLLMLENFTLPVLFYKPFTYSLFCHSNVHSVYGKIEFITLCSSSSEIRVRIL